MLPRNSCQKIRLRHSRPQEVLGEALGFIGSACEGHKIRVASASEAAGTSRQLSAAKCLKRAKRAGSFSQMTRSRRRDSAPGFARIAPSDSPQLGWSWPSFVMAARRDESLLKCSLAAPVFSAITPLDAMAKR